MLGYFYHLIESADALGILPFIFMEDFFPIFPATLLLIAYGGSQGGLFQLPVWFVVSLWIFPIIAHGILFWIGYKKIHKLLECRYIRSVLPPTKVHQAERFINKYGVWIIPLGAVLTGFRFFMALAAGTSRMSYWKYLFFDAITLLIWIIWTLTLGVWIFGS